MNAEDSSRRKSADLKQQRHQCLIRSERAILDRPCCYAKIKKLLQQIIAEPIDIDEYHPLAARLALLLDQMGPDTIFFLYYHENIDPTGKGRARHLRSVCRDLTAQIDELNQWRAEQRKIKLTPAIQPD
jgi:hypothetical protein